MTLHVFQKLIFKTRFTVTYINVYIRIMFFFLLADHHNILNNSAKSSKNIILIYRFTIPHDA